MAKQMLIKPSELQPVHSNSIYHRCSGAVHSLTDTEVKFGFEVKLQPGKIIKKIGYYHTGIEEDGRPAPRTSISLWGKKFGSFFSLDPLMSAESSDHEFGKLIETRNMVGNVSRKIKRGYTYSLVVTSSNQGSYIHGIVITYK